MNNGTLKLNKSVEKSNWVSFKVMLEGDKSVEVFLGGNHKWQCLVRNAH